MLSKWATYLMGNVVSEVDEEAEAATKKEFVIEEDGAADALISVGRLRTIELDDWVLIDDGDISLDGAVGMEGSWFVTPPACFTQTCPENVETSPLEDLLIEHPSMSVYRASNSIFNESFLSSMLRTAPPLMIEPEFNRMSQAEFIINMINGFSLERRRTVESRDQPTDNHRCANVSERSARNEEDLRVAQRHSAQKVFQKRSSQNSKRKCLERNNKVRQVASGNSHPTRRQDRLRFNNSRANNNRKC